MVTGASSGIGKATARAFAGAGAGVALAARSDDRLNTLAGELKEAEGKIASYHLDVTKREQAFAVIERVADEFGKLDILINNAGIGHCCSLEEMKWEDVQRVIDTNLSGVIHCTQAVIPIMKNQGGGQIVNVSSTVGHKGVPMMSVYCATKFAVRGLNEALRLELLKDNIEVISVCPGTTATEFFDHAITNGKGWWLKHVGKMSAEAVAVHILKACARHKRETVLSAEGKAMVLINKLFPRFVDFMTMKVAAR